MKPLICAGNWKLFKTPEQARAFLKTFRSLISPEQESSFILFPPALCAGTMSDELKTSQLSWGLQNCHSAGEGAFTGENSGLVAKSMGAKYCLVGHSERRKIFRESNHELTLKVKFLQSIEVCPLLCVGETDEERVQGLTEQVVLEQVAQGLSAADLSRPFMLAYEPVWAIGTGKVATSDQAQEVHALIRKFLREELQVTRPISILYGGSVKPENSKSLATQKDIDGFLVGGASLEPESFFRILKEAQS